jgi:hypothetical protein
MPIATMFKEQETPYLPTLDLDFNTPQQPAAAMIRVVALVHLTEV